MAAAIVGFVLGLAAFGVRQMLGMPDPNAGFMAKAALLAAEVAAAAAIFAVYAIRTGVVLRQKLPKFPTLTWNALHVLIGVGIGVFVAISEMRTEAAPREGAGTAVVMSVAIGGALAGALIGAAWGFLQSLVLGKAAREVSFWIHWSAFAGTTLGGYALVLYLDSDPSLGNEILMQLVSFAVAVVSGAVMLPALHRLQPR